MGSVAIKTNELGKSYALGLHQQGNLRETLAAAARQPLEVLRRRRAERDPDILWALKDVSMTIADGDEYRASGDDLRRLGLAA